MYSEGDQEEGLIGPINYATVSICGQQCKALLDTGSQVTMISADYVQRHPILSSRIISPTKVRIEGAGRQEVPHLGMIYVDITVQDLGVRLSSVPALVVPKGSRSDDIPCLLGTNVIRASRDILHNKHGREFMTVVQRVSAPWFMACQAINVDGLDIADKDGSIGLVRFIGRKPLTIPAGHKQIIKARAPRGIRDRTFVAMLSKPPSDRPFNVETSICLVQDGRVLVEVTNPTDDKIFINRHAPLASLEAVNVLDGVPPSSHGISEHVIGQGDRDNITQAGAAGPIPGLSLPLEGLSKEQRDALGGLLQEYEDVFSSGSQDFGHTTTVTHEIPLIDPTPFRMPYRRIHPKDFKEVQEHLKELQEAGVIRPSKSPFASPIVVVRKKDGHIRMCVDFRKLNSRTTRDAYPIPRIEESLDALGKAKYFSSLDLMSGYLQVEVVGGDQPKTAFTTPMGLFEYTRMPFGLMNAPATFQRLMNTVLGDLNLSEVLIYLDDVIVFSDSIEEHVARLKHVFHRLRKHGLKLKPSKCHLLLEQVKYLGHVVSKEGIQTDPDKIEAVKTWPVPKTSRDVRSFLGFTGYYRRFIAKYAVIARPLFELIGGKPKAKKGSSAGSFQWTNDCERAFLELKERLITTPVLAYPDFGIPFILQTDASLDGLGAVLAQEQDGKEQVVAYASRSLRPGERRYPAHKLEFKALHWAATVKFKDYLYGQKVTAVTDSNPLTYVLKSAKLDAHGQRWVNDLSQCDMEISYRPGKSNDNADGLSRIPRDDVRRILDKAATLAPLDSGPDDSTSESDNADVVVKVKAVNPRPSAHEMESKLQGKEEDPATTLPAELSREQLIQAQMKDEVISKVVHRMTHGHKPTRRQCDLESNQVRKLLRKWEQLSIVSGLLLYQHTQDGSQAVPVLPRSRRSRILEGVHDRMGHLGYERTLDLARERCFWVGMASDVKRHLHRCKRCTLRKTAEPKGRTPLTSIRTSRPLELVCLDFLSLEASTGGIENVLVITDHFTRHAQAYPTRDQTAATVAKTFWGKYVVHYGIPERIHSDQGKCFDAAVIHELCNLLGIAKSRTTPYHPQGNGMTERYNSTLLNMLGTLHPSLKPSWKDHVETLTHAYNCTKHASTGFSPYYLMFLRKPRIPVDLLLEKEENEAQEVDEKGYVERMQQALVEAYKLAQTNADDARRKQAANHDKRARGSGFSQGDKVLVANKSLRGRHKIADRWEESPHTVLRSIPGSPVYIVRNDFNGVERTLHRDLLTACTFSNSEGEEVSSNVCHEADDESSSISSGDTDNSDTVSTLV